MPVRGSRLVGTVNKVAHDFIGALVLDTFNVAIAAENIREELVSSVDEAGAGRARGTTNTSFESGRRLFSR